MPFRCQPSLKAARWPFILQEAAEEEEAGVEEEEGALASPSAAAVRAALEANRALQARLLRLLRSTDRAIDRNVDIVTRLKALDLKHKAALAGRQVGGRGWRLFCVGVGGVWVVWMGGWVGGGGAVLGGPGLEVCESDC